MSAAAGDRPVHRCSDGKHGTVQEGRCMACGCPFVFCDRCLESTFPAPSGGCSGTGCVCHVVLRPSLDEPAMLPR